MSEELSVTGYTYTHFDCPECGDANEAEGDFTGTFECESCGTKFTVE